MKTKKIKILEAIRQGKVGGGETHVLELCSNLDKTKYEPMVLSFTAGPMIDELKKRGIRTKVIYTEKGFSVAVWKQVLEFIRAEKFDIIHAHGTRAMSNVFWAAKKAKLPLLYTVHGWSFHPDQKWWIRQMRERSEQFLTHQADTTICVSKSNQTDGIERFKMQRSIVIYNAVDLQKFNPYRKIKNIRQELGIDSKTTLIAYIARITTQKDPFTMLQAMKIVAESNQDIKLLMVGDGDLKEQTLKLANDLGLQNDIIFQSFRSDIPDVLHAADIYCLPSLWEGFPIGILEAMAMKKCVVASPVDGTKELLNDGITGLMVQNGEADKLAQTLLLLHHDPALRNNLAQHAYDFVINNFHIQRLIDELEVVYSLYRSDY